MISGPANLMSFIHDYECKTKYVLLFRGLIVKNGPQHVGRGRRAFPAFPPDVRCSSRQVQRRKGQRGYLTWRRGLAWISLTEDVLGLTNGFAPFAYPHTGWSGTSLFTCAAPTLPFTHCRVWVQLRGVNANGATIDFISAYMSRYMHARCCGTIQFAIGIEAV